MNLDTNKNLMKLLGMMFFMMTVTFLSAQMPEVVEWTAHYDADKNSILIQADMDDDWVIYSQHTDPEGPIPLEFEFITSDPIQLDGDVIELTEPTKMMSEMFGVEVIKFKEAASFEQKLKERPAGGALGISVTYMTCDSKRCLPPTTVPLEVKF